MRFMLSTIESTPAKRMLPLHISFIVETVPEKSPVCKVNACKFHYGARVIARLFKRCEMMILYAYGNGGFVLYP